MAVNLNGQICRNLPDQVAKNQEDIKELQTEASSYATIEYVDDGLATKADKDDADLTGTTTAENIIVSGDAVIDSLEVQTSITVPTPTDSNDAANKSYVDGKVANLYKYKGTKTNYSNLPVTGNVVGDVWNVTNAYQSYPAGTNYAWTGLAWDALGGSINLSNYATQTDLQNGLATKMTIGAVAGTNDGTNWTNITINGTTKNIPAGGSGGSTLYKHNISFTLRGSTPCWLTWISDRSTAIEVYFDLLEVCADNNGFVVGQNSSSPSVTGYYVIACRSDGGVFFMYYLTGSSTITIAGTGVTAGQITNISDTVTEL